MSDYIVHKAVELSALSAKARAAITTTEWIISPKYDGCHVVFIIDNGEFVIAYSRSGEVVRSMDHVGRELATRYRTGCVAVCGEAWMIGKEFNEISGAFRRHAPQPQLTFVPFDLVRFEYADQDFGPQAVHLYSGESYLARLRLLEVEGLASVIDPSFYTFEGPLEVALVNAEGLAKRLKKRTDAFFDGAVLAQANGLYKVGSGKGGEFIKCKPLLSETVTCNALFPAIGEKTGKYTLALGFTLNGQAQKVSTGLTQSQVNAFIATHSLILGQRIEVEAMGLTVNGFLREPRFKGIRTDA